MILFSKKSIFFGIFSFLLFSNLFSQNMYKYPPEIIAQYSAGSGANEFKLTNSDWDYPIKLGPTNITVNESGEIFIFDYYNLRIVGLDNNFLFKDYININEGQVMRNALDFYIADDLLFSFEIDVCWFQANKFNGDSVISLGFRSQKTKGLIDDYNYYADKDLIIVYKKDGQMIGVVNPENVNRDNIRKNTLNTKQLKDYIEKNSLKKYYIDDDNNLFINGLFYTRKFDKFDKYWKNYYKINNMADGRYSIIPKTYLKGYFHYVGMDSNHNIYFRHGSASIYIFNNKGVLIDLFKYDQDSNEENKTKRVISPAIHPSGDLYFMTYSNSKDCILIRYKNVWDPSGREAWYTEHSKTYGTLTDNSVRVRKSPSLTGEKTGFLLMKDQRVEILDQTESMIVGDMNAPWYKIRTEDGQEGWAYGFFIDVDV